MRLEQWRSTALTLLVLAACHGCGESSTAPQPWANIHTTLSLADAILTPGDTIVATVRAVNEGTTSASFLFYCGRYLWASIENGDGECVVGCISACGSGAPIPLELQPGEMLKQTFRFASVDWEGNAYPPGLYAVNGGIAARGATLVRTGFVINEP